MFTTSKTVGEIGEAIAFRHLVCCGYKILFRNYRCAFGEVDLVARHRNMLVFIEVKTRKTEVMGAPLEAIDGRKKRQLWNVARHYLHRYGGAETPCRFDVVSVLLEPRKSPLITVVRNAFEERR